MKIPGTNEGLKITSRHFITYNEFNSNIELAGMGLNKFGNKYIFPELKQQVLKYIDTLNEMNIRKYILGGKMNTLIPFVYSPESEVLDKYSRIENRNEEDLLEKGFDFLIEIDTSYHEQYLKLENIFDYYNNKGKSEYFIEFMELLAIEAKNYKS